MKLKEVARLWGLYTILTKEMGFGLQGTINGEMPRKYMGELLESKGYLGVVLSLVMSLFLLI